MKITFLIETPDIPFDKIGRLTNAIMRFAPNGSRVRTLQNATVDLSGVPAIPWALDVTRHGNNWHERGQEPAIWRDKEKR